MCRYHLEMKQDKYLFEPRLDSCLIYLLFAFMPTETETFFENTIEARNRRVFYFVTIKDRAKIL